MKKTLEIKISDYENPIKELIGQCISDVKYYEIDYGEPFWNEIEFHSIDYGVEIKTTINNTYYFIWDNQFTAYDLKFQKGNIKQEFSKQNTAGEFNVTENEKWIGVLNQRIIGIKSNWEYYQYEGEKEKQFYPQDVEIEFDNGKFIYISAMEISDNKPMGMKDHLTIFFDKKTAEKYKLE